MKNIPLLEVNQKLDMSLDEFISKVEIRQSENGALPNRYDAYINKKFVTYGTFSTNWIKENGEDKNKMARRMYADLQKLGQVEDTSSKKVDEGRGIEPYNKTPAGSFNGILPKTNVWLVWVFTNENGKYKTMNTRPDRLTNLINIILGSSRTTGGEGTDSWLAGIFTDQTEAKKLYDALDMPEERK